MPTIAHIINVGQGSMVLLLLADGTSMLYDCNVTDENQDDVIGYLRRALPRAGVDIFVNSHRDADHMRGVLKIHAEYPIETVWDSGVAGGTTDSTEYLEYMELKRAVDCVTVEAKRRWDFGKTRIRVMSARNDKLPDDANAQSIVMKVQHHSAETGLVLSSLMLTGDSDAVAWRKAIVPEYSASDLKSSILMASHHGSISFFDDPSDEKNYYTAHIKKMSPAMTLVSVGPNVHGHPDKKAIELYKKYSAGSSKGNKVFRTDKKGNMRLVLKNDGGWKLTTE